MREAKLRMQNDYHTRLIVLCVYLEKYMPQRVRNPGYPDLRALLRAGYVTRLKVTFELS